MSEHDPREDYDDEPYSGPLAPPHIVLWPAAMMWAFGLLQFIIAQMWLVFMASTIFVTEIVDGNQSVAEVWKKLQYQSAVWLGLAAWIAGTWCAIVVIRGANDLKRFRNYGWVVTGAVLTLLSVPFVYLAAVQFPLGVWLLALLLRRDVRARFEAVARGVPPAYR